MRSKQNFTYFYKNTTAKLFFVCFIFLILFNHKPLKAQNNSYFNPTSNPISPSVYQFLKAGNINTEQYKGQLDLRIPLYTIIDGDINFPIELTYQSGGIKVNEESSFVGTGWSLSLGSVTQIVQDRDDFDDEMIKVKPDYFDGYNYPRLFPPYYLGCSYLSPNPNIPISNGQISPMHQWIIYQDYYIPINGEYQRLPAFYTANGGPCFSMLDCYDSEPDMFSLNVNGIQLNFIFENNNIVKLNDVGNRYKLIYINNNDNISFQLTDPNGINYYFETSFEIRNTMVSTYGYSYTNVSYNNEDLLNRVWQLTRITDFKQNEINLKYFSTDYVKNLPTATQKFKQFLPPQETLFCMGSAAGFTDWIDSNDPNPSRHTAESYTETYVTFSGQQNQYCDTIRFKNGVIVFYYSQREDIHNDSKLDSIKLINDFGNVVKRYVFATSYQHSVHNLPNEIIVTHSGKDENELRKRLFLDSLYIGQEKWVFKYFNRDNLPPKLSHSVDYWGYCNGSESNQSYIPNPIHIGFTHAPDNYEDHRPNLFFALSGALEQITYPTGATNKFDYELHSYEPSPYCLFDTIGNGLRLKSKTHYEGNIKVDSCAYSYNGGKNQSPRLFSINTTYEWVRLEGICQSPFCGDWLRIKDFPYSILSSSSFYYLNSYIPLNEIGYEFVEEKYYHKNNETNGVIKKQFTNNYHNSNIAHNVEMVLPSAPNYFHNKNGSLVKEEFFDSSNRKVKETFYSYKNVTSNLSYGCRSSFYKFQSCSYIDFNTTCKDQSYIYYMNKSLDLVGYYPIYDKLSLVCQKDEISWVNNIPIIEKTKFYYDDKMQDSKIVKYAHGDSLITRYYYPYNYSTNNSYYLVSRNIINIPIHISKEKNNNFIESRTTDFGIFHGLILPTKVKTITHDLTEKVDYNFNAYDNKGNLLLWQIPPSFYTSRIYDEGKNQILANITNSTLDETGHTSFENIELNGWTKFDANEFETLPANVFTGKSSMEVTGVSGPFKVFTVGQNAEKRSGYKASVWAKGEGAYLHIEVNGEWSSHVKVKNEINDGLWHKLEVELPRHKIQPYFSQGHNLKIKVYVGTERGTVYFDDLRFHPSDAQMTTYTHEPLIGVTSISNESNKPEFYIYDSFGRLEYIKDFEGNIIKKNDYHYRTNGQ